MAGDHEERRLLASGDGFPGLHGDAVHRDEQAAGES